MDTEAMLCGNEKQFVLLWSSNHEEGGNELWAGWPQFELQQKQEIFLCSTASRPDQLWLQALSLEEHEADR
jgi:hypothetical protein